eukprot:4239897-Pyramimonas_sp.AAC.1
MPGLGLLPELSPKNYWSSSISWMVMVFLTELELDMSYRAACHSSRKDIIKSASLKYLDFRTRLVTRAGSEQTPRTLLCLER